MEKSLKENFFPSKKEMLGKHKFKQIQLFSNHFSINIDKSQKFIEWHVKFVKKSELAESNGDPTHLEDGIPLDSRIQRDNTFQTFRKGVYKRIGNFVLTGQTLFTVKKINESPKSQEIFENQTDFSLVLTKTNENISHTSLIPNQKSRFQFLRIINSYIKQILKKNNFQEWGRNKKYYNKQISTFLKQHNIRVYQGCTYKADILEGGLKLLISPSNRIIRQKNMWEEFLESKDFESYDKSVISKYFLQSALCIYNQRVVKIHDIDMNKTIMSPFDDKKYKNYKEYYEQRYKVKFQYNDQILVVSHKKIKTKNPDGSTTVVIEKSHFPPELLLPTGLKDNMRNDFRVMKDLGKITIVFPDKKFAKIKQGLNIIKKDVKSCGLNFEVDPDSNKVVGFQLPNPTLNTTKGSLFLKKDRIQVQSMLRNKKIDKWVFLYDQRNSRDTKDVIENLKKASKRFGIKINNPSFSYQIPKKFENKQLIDLLKEKSLLNT